MFFVFVIGMVVGVLMTARLLWVDQTPVSVEQVNEIESEEVVLVEESPAVQPETIVYQDKMYTVLTRRSFEQNGEHYEVMHVCDPTYLYEEFVGASQGQPTKCAYGGSEYELLLLSHADEWIPLHIDELQLVGHKAVLWDVAPFPDERSFMIVFEPDGCDYLGLCIDFYDQLYVFDVASGDYVRTIEAVGTLVDLEMMQFNADATRYVIFNGCPEGCPDAYVEGYDLLTGQAYDFVETLSRYKDERLDFFVDTQQSGWIDVDTFRVYVDAEQPDGTKQPQIFDLNFDV